MNIEGKGFEQWTLELEKAIKNTIGGPVSKRLLRQQEDDLAEQWFQGTTPQEAARKLLRSLIRGRR